MSNQAAEEPKNENANRPKEQPPVEKDRWNIPLTQAEFRQKLFDYFNLSDLRTLAFDLEIDYDFGPIGKRDFILAFVGELKKQDRIRSLWKMCRDQRPNANWGE